MKNASESTDPFDFLQIAVAHNLISVEDGRKVMSAATARGIPPAQLAVEDGLLDSVDADIVAILSRPDGTVPGYEILDLLGRGGMGVVFRARQKNLDRVVALKTILFGQTTLPGILARFEQEARSIGRLRHPNIVTAYDFGKHDGRLFFAMEELEGEDLGGFLRRHGPFGEREAWGIARQAAAGLSHAAGAGIVHRDIKPGNLFLIAPPEGFSLPSGLPMVKITDFGLAYLARSAPVSDRITAAGSTLGTPQFMAPEQFSASDVDHRADIYSLGATVYQMLTGEPPFEGKSLVEIVGQKVRGELAPLKERAWDVSDASAELVADMMAFDVGARPSDYATLLARIDELPEFEVGSSRPFRPVPRHGKNMVCGTDLLTEAGASTDDASLQETEGLLPTRADAAIKLGPAGGSSSPIPERAGQTPPRSIRFGLMAMITVVAAIAVSAVAWFTPRHTGPAPDLNPAYVPSDWVRPLFDGRSISNWSNPRGEWSPWLDVEGGYVLRGRGSIRRTLPEPETGPLLHYRLTLGVDLHEADAVEVHFGIPPSGAEDEPLGVVRISREQVAMGRRARDGAAFEATDAPAEITSLGRDRGGQVDQVSRYRVLRIERQPDKWNAWFDDVPVGRLPTRTRERAEFWLVAEGGPALFESLEVRELVRLDMRKRRLTLGVTPSVHTAAQLEPARWGTSAGPLPFALRGSVQLRFALSRVGA